MKKIIFILLLVIFLFPLTNADLGTFEQGQTVTVKANLNSTSVNVSIYFPNSSVAIDNQPMTNLKGNIFGLDFNNTDTLGTYIYDYCDEIGDNCVENTFEITTFGTTLENSGAVVYGILLLIFFFMNLIIFYIISRLDQENFRDDQGIFIGISIQKYIRVVLIGVSYGLILLTLNLMSAAARTDSQISQFSGIIGGIFLAMLSAAWIWTLIIVIWLAVMAWKDGNFIKQFKDGMEKAQNSF